MVGGKQFIVRVTHAVRLGFGSGRWFIKVEGRTRRRARVGVLVEKEG